MSDGSFYGLRYTCLPDEDHSHNPNQKTSDFLLFGLPCSKTTIASAKGTLTRMYVMILAGEWPSHVSRIGKPATIECILDCPDSFRVLGAEQLLPALMQTTVETRRWRSMRTQQRYNDRGVYQDDCVRDDDERRALDLSPVEMLASLLVSREVIAAFQQQPCDDGQGSSEASERI